MTLYVTLRNSGNDDVRFTAENTTPNGTRTPAENTGNGDTSTRSDAESDAFSRHQAFSDLLTEWGFTGRQLMLIDDALRDTGLQIIEVTGGLRDPS